MNEETKNNGNGTENAAQASENLKKMSVDSTEDLAVGLHLLKYSPESQRHLASLFNIALASDDDFIKEIAHVGTQALISMGRLTNLIKLLTKDDPAKIKNLFGATND